MINLNNIDTEKRNKNTLNIDKLNTLQVLETINTEDALVANAVKLVLGDIAIAVDYIYEKVKNGGRLVYIGAGTSGRLGVLDAVECPPTFGVNDMVVAIIAGGENAFVKSKEGAEDDLIQGEEDLKNIDFTVKDVLVGISASGRTPYVIGALKYAKSLGTIGISLCCTKNSEMGIISDVDIAPIVGPEVITGSTRMKSGTAQKIILNMISTTLMIKLGKVYSNLMVDLKSSNKKLKQRSINIVATATDVSPEVAENALKMCDYSAKHAIFCLLAKVSYEDAVVMLNNCGGKISEGIK